jgi:hypothetical protein
MELSYLEGSITWKQVRIDPDSFEYDRFAGINICYYKWEGNNRKCWRCGLLLPINRALQLKEAHWLF